MAIDPLAAYVRITAWMRRTFLGAARSLEDPSVFHKISLIPLLAWIGLGADGLSSSAYGPAEGFLNLGSHAYIALFLGAATAATVFIISYAYSRIIEHFPGGGGGYIVATHTIGEKAGVVSGSALLIDYVLTIAVSLVACTEALFSFVSPALAWARIPFTVSLIVFITVLNLRGVRESVLLLAPIFLVFILSHAVLIALGIFSHSAQVIPLFADLHGSFTHDFTTIGFVGILAIFLRAYSLGGGTYTGIEAVANGMQIMREPKVETGKRTMAYMAASLAVVSVGLYLCYYLWEIRPVAGRTLNAVLASGVFGGSDIGGWIALITIISEGALLIVAAQAGFIDGPRVMANMAIDSWLPRRFASLSERLTMTNGILLMGCSALLVLIITGGSITALIVMYAINVFVTFSLSQFGMARFFYRRRSVDSLWKKHCSIHVAGCILCVTILSITVFEKLSEGGWITLFLTLCLITVCYLIRGHYHKVSRGLQKFESLALNIPSTGKFNDNPVDPRGRTAIQMVSGYNGFGIQTFLSTVKNFPDFYDNFIFVSIAVIDSGTFKGTAEIRHLEESVRKNLVDYVELARSMGIPAEYRIATGTDVVEEAAVLVTSITKEFPCSTCFAGQIVFRHEHPFQRILHNETAFAIQRRLQLIGITTVITPIQAHI